MPPDREKPDAARHLARYGRLELNILVGQAVLQGEDLLLTQKEFALLYLLIQHKGQVVSQRELYETAWNLPITQNNLALKSSMSRLRRKLSGHGYRIVPVRGAGYRLEEVEKDAPAVEGEG